MVGLKRKELAGRRFTRIVSVGGGAKNLAWLQIQADIFDATVYCLSVEEGPALGATMIAALGLGGSTHLKVVVRILSNIQMQRNLSYKM